jgi:phage tail-like protein
VRGTLALDELGSPHPLATLLPGLFQDDDFAMRFTSALDGVLAPVLGVLDSVDAYVDPRLAPLDFVTWLAQWVGTELDASWPEERQRALVASAADLYAWRGTNRGLSALIEITTGILPEIEETGGVTWTGSAPPAGRLPGSAGAAIVVRVRTPRGVTVDPARLDRMVAAAKPAHVSHRVEVVSGGSGGSAGSGGGGGGGQRRPSGSGGTGGGGQRRASSSGSRQSAAGAASGQTQPRPRPSKAAPPAATPPSRSPMGGDGSELDEPWSGG